MPRVKKNEPVALIVYFGSVPASGTYLASEDVGGGGYTQYFVVERATQMSKKELTVNALRFIWVNGLWWIFLQKMGGNRRADVHFEQKLEGRKSLAVCSCIHAIGIINVTWW